MKTITLQPASRVDRITADGRELTQLPYPYHVEVGGLIQRQDHWRGYPLLVVGFSADPSKEVVDLLWSDTVADPLRAIGMYLVTSNIDGSWQTHLPAIESVKINHPEGVAHSNYRLDDEPEEEV